MPRTDLKAERKDLYAPKRGSFVEVVVPPMIYLGVEGHGDPNVSEEYNRAVQALFAASYAAKFLSKAELGKDYVVMPLEGQWWAEDMSDFRTREKARWSWRMLIRQPDWVGADLLEQARHTAAKKAAAKKAAAADALLHRHVIDEGRCVQTLHIGSYDDETPVLASLHDEYIPAHGLQMVGLHHEIYLSDPRRTRPAKLRTILRQPVTATPEATGPTVR